MGRRPSRRGGVAAPQQEARQREEHRDSEVEPAEQPPHYPAGVPGLKGHVGDDNPDGRAGAHSLDRRQEATGSSDALGLPSGHCHSDQCAGRIRIAGKRVVKQPMLGSGTPPGAEAVVVNNGLSLCC